MPRTSQLTSGSPVFSFGQVTKPRWNAWRSRRNWCRHLLKQWLLLQLLLLLQLWRQVRWRWTMAMLLDVMLLCVHLLH